MISVFRTLRDWLTIVLDWSTAKSPLIIAATAVIALFVYIRQADIMDGNLELMQQQKLIMDNTLDLMQQQTEVLTDESIRRFRPFPYVIPTQAERPKLVYGIREPDGGVARKHISEVSHGSKDWENRKTVALAVQGVSFE